MDNKRQDFIYTIIALSGEYAKGLSVVKWKFFVMA